MIRLPRNWNRYELISREGDDLSDKRMQYPHAIQALTVYAYNHTIKYFAPGGVYKGHLTALGLSFLEVTYFFSGQFRDPAFTGRKKCQAHDSNLLRKNREGRQTGMDELLNKNEGVAGSFYMDVDTLVCLYSDMAHQLRYLGEFRGRPNTPRQPSGKPPGINSSMRPSRKLGNNIGAGRLNRARHIPRASGSRVCWTMPSLFWKMTLNTDPLDDTSRIGPVCLTRNVR